MPKNLSRKDKQLKMDVCVFIDHSNFHHQGQCSVAALAGFINSYAEDLGFHYDALLTTVLDGRKLSGDAVIVASTPSLLERRWRSLEKPPFHVLEFPRNVKNKEKGNDVALAVEACKVIFAPENMATPKTLALVLGDGDYIRLVRTALELQWNVEIHFWPESEFEKKLHVFQYIVSLQHPSDALAGCSGLMKKEKGIIFKPIDRFREFAFVSSASGIQAGAYALEVGGGSLPQDGNHEDLFRFSREMFPDVFSWWTFIGGGFVRFYFARKEDMLRIKKRLKEKGGYDVMDVIKRKRINASNEESCSSSYSSSKKSRRWHRHL